MHKFSSKETIYLIHMFFKFNTESCFSNFAQKQCNASQTLCDIIRLSREQMSQLQEKADPDPLLQLIES